MKRTLLCILAVVLVLGLAAYLVSRDVWPASARVSAPAAQPAQIVPAATARPLTIVTAAPEAVPTAQPSRSGDING